MSAPRRHTPNLKRKLRPMPHDEYERHLLAELAERVRYGGNPQHKSNPGDFDLTPPSQARQFKTLCDRAGVFKRSEGLALLREGVRRGLISDRTTNGWPKNIWAVSASGEPVEAILENPDRGTYHGYAMGDDDPLAEDVLTRWRR